MVQTAGPGSRPELVIGLVTPIGTRTAELAEAVRRELARWKYQAVVIKLSDEWGASAPATEMEDERVSRLIAAGNDFCRRHQDQGSPDRGRAALARLAVSRIRRRRLALHRQDGCHEPAAELVGRSRPETAYIVHSLKRPHEVQLLREVYGRQFLLVGAQGTLGERFRDLMSRPLSGLPDEHEAIALRLVRLDASESDPFGQRVNDTYPLASFFLSSTDPSRVFSVLFGKPIAPTAGEYAMYVARAAAARSLAPSRKVGAALVVDEAVVATGYNDVPPGVEPDVLAGIDTSEQFKRDNVRDTLELLRKAGMLVDTSTGIDGLIQQAMDALEGGQLMSVIEYQRAVHAEARTLDDALARGVVPVGGELFVTTYPCHLCYKHALSARLRAVRYIDPYPKSRAAQMYPDATEGRLLPYEGIAPGMYEQLFVDRPPFVSEADGTFAAPDPSTALPRLGAIFEDRTRDANERSAVNDLLEEFQ